MKSLQKIKFYKTETKSRLFLPNFSHFLTHRHPESSEVEFLSNNLQQSQSNILGKW